MDDWTIPKILDLAPDPASRKAGQGLGRAAFWQSTGRDGPLAWGSIKGSGSAPYLAALSLAGPAPVFKCSCPSRKFPCKHGLGLLLVLADGHVPPGAVPDWVAAWDAKRRAAAHPAADGPDAAPPKPVDAKAQDRRRNEREAKVSAGMDELDLWMRDLMRRGLAGARGEKYSFWDRMGGRLVDAQAPGLARRVRALPGLLTAGGDGATVLALGRLALLVQGWRRQDVLDAPLRAELRAAVGFPVTADDLAAVPGTAGAWTVLAQEIVAEDAVQARHTWLAGATPPDEMSSGATGCGTIGTGATGPGATGSGATARIAHVLDFAAGGRPFPPGPATGTSFNGEVVFYPGAAGLRAVIRGGEPAPPQPFIGAGGVAAALDGVADALGRVPWLEEWPVLLSGVRFVRQDGGGLALADAGGALPLEGTDAAAPFAAAAGGGDVQAFGVWDGAALRLLALGCRGRLHVPSAATPGMVRAAARLAA